MTDEEIDQICYESIHIDGFPLCPWIDLLPRPEYRRHVDRKRKASDRALAKSVKATREVLRKDR